MIAQIAFSFVLIQDIYYVSNNERERESREVINGTPTEIPLLVLVRAQNKIGGFTRARRSTP